MRGNRWTAAIGAMVLLVAACGSEPPKIERYDTIIKGGTVYDGTGADGIIADVAIEDDRIAAIGDLSSAEADTIIDAAGKVVSPGFINMLSWAVDTLALDGRGLSDVTQGVTLEVFGEGWSMGPLNDVSRKALADGFIYRDQPMAATWDTLGGYLEHLEARGVSMNVASFVGATTLRINHIGLDDRPPTAEELAAMQADVRLAMEEGAMGIGSSLIYAPAFYAKTDELIALAQIVGEYDGMYISHMRSEGNRFLEAVDELITIAEQGGVAAEIYHLKASGKENWGKLDQAIAKVNAARARGLDITADMYTYPAGATGLDAAMPPWVQAGDFEAWAARLKDPEIRSRVIAEMRTPTDEWENLMLAAGADGMLLAGFKKTELRHLVGKSLAEVAAERGVSPEEAALDLVIEDGSRVGTIYFLMSDENVRKKLKLPWLSFGSDAGALDPAIDAEFGGAHPRAYGTFARVIGKFVRDEEVLTMADAIRKLTSLPAANLKIRERGTLTPGYYADVVVFDPATVTDHATFAKPHALSTGVEHVWVNGEQVLRDGAHTGAMPGRVVRGPGWTGWQKRVAARAAE